MAAFDSGLAGQARTRFFVFKKIYECKWQILWIGFEARRNGDANILFSIFRTQPGRQMTQQTKLAFTNNAFCLLHHNAEEAIDFAVVAR